MTDKLKDAIFWTRMILMILVIYSFFTGHWEWAYLIIILSLIIRTIGEFIYEKPSE